MLVKLPMCESTRLNWSGCCQATLNEQIPPEDVPLIARLFSSDPSSYGYLAESAGQWLDQQALADTLRAAGWTGVGWRDLLFGAVAIHTALRPTAGGARTAG